jgi:hypothetical protein
VPPPPSPIPISNILKSKPPKEKIKLIKLSDVTHSTQLRPDTFRGSEVGREEVYDEKDIAVHDKSCINNAFGHRNHELKEVND